MLQFSKQHIFISLINLHSIVTHFQSASWCDDSDSCCSWSLMTKRSSQLFEWQNNREDIQRQLCILILMCGLCKISFKAQNKASVNYFKWRACNRMTVVNCLHLQENELSMLVFIKRYSSVKCWFHCFALLLGLILLSWVEINTLD